MMDYKKTDGLMKEKKILTKKSTNLLKTVTN